MSFVQDPVVFGPFRLDPLAPRLDRDGSEVELRPQALAALQSLLRHTGHFVDYDSMIHEAWGGAVVSKHTVAVTVGEVKKVLKEFGCWITYRPRLGYRLEVPQSEDLIRHGNHFWNRFTREGLEKALLCYRRAAEKTRTTSARSRESPARTFCWARSECGPLRRCTGSSS